LIKKSIIIFITVGLLTCASTPFDPSKEIDGHDYLKYRLSRQETGIKLLGFGE